MSNSNQKSWPVVTVKSTCVSDEDTSEVNNSDNELYEPTVLNWCGKYTFGKEDGLLLLIPSVAKPIDYFNMFLDIVFLEEVVREANRQAEVWFVSLLSVKTPEWLDGKNYPQTN